MVESTIEIISASSALRIAGESLIPLFGLQFSISSIVQLIAFPLGLGALIFAAYQAYLSRKANEVVALQMRYQMIFETNRFIFNNPEFAHFAVNGKRYEIIKQMNEPARKRQAALDLLVDNFEFYFLIGLHEHKAHAHRLVSAFLSNPHIRSFLRSPKSGVLRPEFERILSQMNVRGENP